jgi:hypothetical protein
VRQKRRKAPRTSRFGGKGVKKTAESDEILPEAEPSSDTVFRARVGVLTPIPTEGRLETGQKWRLCVALFSSFPKRTGLKR